ncbi:MAG: PAS domain-containing sensor histidine kinase [Sphingopyxis sp.]|nr:PAS domain-containing sensor histidine kinase [Sphingopyxis sp.]
MSSRASGETAAPVPAPRELDIADLASESVIIFDTAGVIQYWNPASEALYGWPALAMVGRGIGHLSSRTADEDEHWRLLVQEGVWQGLVSRRTPSGAMVAADVRQYVRFNNDGTPRDVVEYGQRSSSDAAGDGADWHIPDRKMAASWEIDIGGALQKIGEIAAFRRTGAAADRALLNTLGLELVQATRIIDVNDRVMRLVGGNRGRELLVGQSVASFWPIESRTALADLIVDAVTGGTPDVTYRRQMPSDGILRDPLVTVWLPGDGGPPNRVLVAVNGTADDDRSFLYLRASEARYRKLVQFMPMALWQVDASHMGKIYAELRGQGVTDFGAYLDEHPDLIELAANTVPVTDVNRAAVEMFGAAGALDLMRPVGYLFTEMPEALRNVMIGRFNGQQNHAEPIKVRTLDGRVLDVQFSITYPKPPAELDVTVFSMVDVTERLSIAAELRQLQADFAHAARISTLGELASSIAHEVNQPLAAIVTNAETSLRWLSRGEPNVEKAKELTARIAASGRRANEIVQRIRGMAAKRSPERVALDLNEVVRESLGFVRHEVESRGIRVTADLGRDLPPAKGDRVQLQQVIVNLLVNAVQALEAASEADREILIGTGLGSDGALNVMLRDTGPGIPPDDLDRIFDGFFTTKEEGVGIGLAICQSIIAEHGGAIAASNPAAGGAAFRFSLPVSE